MLFLDMVFHKCNCFCYVQVALKKKKYHCAIELQGVHTRGMMVVDRDYRLHTPPNVIVISQVDVELYEKMLVWAAGGSFYKHQ